ncbi:uncharacterized protein LOC126994346 [Eriocheir sinensis]|uniref:uncharacterized protein LOC126994346 n=1 Tax=Eriocheir sinensis TaxID=95602 RepID=UPI0021C76F28|nr:uncharacterized protein LOC126994346 [Eriocheir sinensis]
MLEEDLNKLSAWSEKWQMNFNITKCSVPSVGTRNPLHGYSLDSTAIGRSECERDLGVLVNSDQQLRKQCISARNRANRVLGFIIKRTVTSRSAEVILRLCLASVRPHSSTVYFDYRCRTGKEKNAGDFDMRQLGVARRVLRPKGMTRTCASPRQAWGGEVVEVERRHTMITGFPMTRVPISLTSGAYSASESPRPSPETCGVTHWT